MTDITTGKNSSTVRYKPEQKSNSVPFNPELPNATQAKMQTMNQSMLVQTPRQANSPSNSTEHSTLTNVGQSHRAFILTQQIANSRPQTSKTHGDNAHSSTQRQSKVSHSHARTYRYGESSPTIAAESTTQR